MVKHQKKYNVYHKKIARQDGYKVNDIMHGGDEPGDRKFQAKFERSMKKMGNMDKLKSSSNKRRIKTYMAESIFNRITNLLEGSLGLQRSKRMHKATRLSIPRAPEKAIKYLRKKSEISKAASELGGKRIAKEFYKQKMKKDNYYDSGRKSTFAKFDNRYQ